MGIEKIKFNAYDLLKRAKIALNITITKTNVRILNSHRKKKILKLGSNKY